MLFNSFSFLAFFAALVVVYYVISPRYRWLLLLSGSLFYYATFQASYVLLLLGVAAMSYGAARGIERSTDPRRKRILLALGVAAGLGTLVVFKYYPVISGLNTGVAVGLSFYTFSCVSYVADVYAGRIDPERHFGYFTVYVSFFPKLLAGPIERAKPFLAELRRPVAFHAARVTAGLQLILWGLFKKVVIADRLAVFVDAAYRQPAFAPPADLVIATYLFAFQLYCDFSGYSDIAIGAAKILGFDLMENFRRPYFSTSVPEFWARRWHLSLTTWFRDYMYIPMGGNRVSRLRQSFNLMAVFLVSGLWHGANWTFVVWGGLNGAYQVVSVATGAARHRAGALLRVPATVRSLAGAVVTFHLILITWVFFRAATLDDATTILTRVVRSAPTLPRLIYARMAGELLLSVALILLLVAIEVFDERKPLWDRVRMRPVYVRWAVYYALLFALIVLGTWNVRQFVYMQF